MFRPALSIALIFALALGGCGKSEQKQAAAKPIEKAIYLSAADCADGGKLKPEECDTLIDRAVKAHEATSEKFKGLRSCEEAAGIDRCEKDVSGTYRMRLQAFMFEIGGPQPIVTALYPSIEGKVGSAVLAGVAAIAIWLIVVVVVRGWLRRREERKGRESESADAAK